MLDNRLDGMSHVTVLQGQFRVSASPADEFGTVLGSCVATCLHDPAAGLGGMNHFLLPKPLSGTERGEVDVHYGVYLMEMLINEMLQQGGRKDRMRAHLYGGANLHRGMQRIGSANAEFARSFLLREGIDLVREDLGGLAARRLDFRPASGLVRCRMVAAADAPEPVVQPPVRPAARGEVELF
ncbi:chemotaxis protein CheD [Novosphingobium aerophilum]|uniref:chemotaxis protein CheD n=1 Tax=Novosphingobium TaxID=165696 RepID=UPI0006C8AD34|nr:MULTISPECIES: chemotaxis protein CheD [unclassified Novosphingobium]KPH64798.1 chemotaxis protein CheD [Novosphingobium sp. ST904]MPS69893.1 chemotaxis protein CheD [Novosphingobium sp.]TCM34528.1 chemotaxis protein CheD [Novosphingobium sp. ST904]WRT92425.1 chemotaxis protein CheD [Novosphingobium sp. RL4]